MHIWQICTEIFRCKAEGSVTGGFRSCSLVHFWSIQRFFSSTLWNLNKKLVYAHPSHTSRIFKKHKHYQNEKLPIPGWTRISTSLCAYRFCTGFFSPLVFLFFFIIWKLRNKLFRNFSSLALYSILHKPATCINFIFRVLYCETTVLSAHAVPNWSSVFHYSWKVYDTLNFSYTSYRYFQGVVEIASSFQSDVWFQKYFIFHSYTNT